MQQDKLSQLEKSILLGLARQAVESAAHDREMQPVVLESLPDRLRQPGVAFITLTIAGQLRGCIGALEPYQPLAEDVVEHAICAATADWRFPPVRPEELAGIKIEISCLSIPRRLEYANPQALLERLCPGVDGVVMQHGGRRSTFLPQVWKNFPSKSAFLSALAEKMGAPPDLWQREPVEISVYQVEEFSE